MTLTEYQIPKEDVWAGRVLIADGGFDCMIEGEGYLVREDAQGLYIGCKGNHQRHGLDGQLDYKTQSFYVGFKLVPLTTEEVAKDAYFIIRELLEQVDFTVFMEDEDIQAAQEAAYKLNERLLKIFSSEEVEPTLGEKIDTLVAADMMIAQKTSVELELKKFLRMAWDKRSEADITASYNKFIAGERK